MTSKELEVGADVLRLRPASGNAGKSAELGDGADVAQERTTGAFELTERRLDMDGCSALDRSSVEALEALLAALEPTDELRLTLALGGDTPVRLGMALGNGREREPHRQGLDAGLDFAVSLVNARRQR